MLFSLQATKERLEKEIEERKEIFEQELVQIETNIKDRCGSVWYDVVFTDCAKKIALLMD